MALARLRFLLAATLLALTGLAADWPQFRGPGASGSSDERGLPVQWSDNENIAWKVELPGFGASSPITLGDRIFLTCYSDYGLDAENPGDTEDLKRHLLALERNGGRVIWDKVVAAEQPEQEYQGFQALHGYASSTPATDGKLLYVFFGKTGVFAFDPVTGQQRWRQSVGTGTHGWGSGSSPVLYKNLVIVNAHVESGAIVALDKQSGSEVWRTKGTKAPWNTPLLVDVPGGKTELVVSMKGEIVGFDPDNGERLWHCTGIDDYVCPSAIAHDGVVYAIGARKSAGLAVRAGGRGDVTETHRLWEVRKGSNVSSPVYHEGHLYWANESKGLVYCVDAKNGEVKYEERLEPRPDRIYASPLVADGKLYYVSRDRGVYVLAARPEFELLAHNALESDTSIFNASPVPSRGQLLLRSDRYLYCIGTTGK
jgi:outer membrane protein assembly factor BamB